MIAALAFALVLASTAEPMRFEDLTFRLAQQPVEPACATMQAWVDQHHGRDDAARGLIWIARRRLEVHERDRARAALVQARGARGRFGVEAVRLLAALDIEDGNLDEAAASASVLASSTDPDVAAEGTVLVAAVEARLRRLYWRFAALAFLAVDVVVRVARTRKKLWPPPFEAGVLAPLLALLVLVGFARGVAELNAVALLAGGGVVLGWARGAHRRGHPLPFGLRALDGVCALVEAAALSYAVLDGGGLLDKLVLTFTAGPA